jgi:hypothetical protein
MEPEAPAQNIQTREEEGGLWEREQGHAEQIGIESPSSERLHEKENKVGVDSYEELLWKRRTVRVITDRHCSRIWLLMDLLTYLAHCSCVRVCIQKTWPSWTACMTGTTEGRIEWPSDLPIAARWPPVSDR